MNKSHLTAITRKKPSVPMVWLEANDKLVGTVLDYGCGKGFDADYYAMDKFDPYHTSGNIIKAQDKLAVNTDYAYSYDTITCNYVLNVIESQEERDNVLEDIQSKLSEGGVAYITLRRDPHIKEGYTSTGTYQATIELDLPVVREVKGKYIMYRLEK